MSKINEKDVEFMSPEEALFLKNKEFAESSIKSSKEQIMVNEVVVKALENELSKLKEQKTNGNSK